MNSQELKAIYASAPVSATPFEVVSISAPWFSKTYHLQNVFTEDISVKLETGVMVDVMYAPMSLSQSSSNADLNYERSFVIQFVNDMVANEQANFNPDVHDPYGQIVQSRGYIYYRNGTISDIQTGVITTRVKEIMRDAKTGGASVKVSTKPANETATGEVATIRRVPMLKGFI